jgi:hypothetical protein
MKALKPELETPFGIQNNNEQSPLLHSMQDQSDADHSEQQGKIKDFLV